MEVIIPDWSGFCPGIKRAENQIMKALEKDPHKSLFILGFLIHNRRFIKHLNELGVMTIEKQSQAPKDALVIIRTHGMEKSREIELRQHAEVMDLTCKTVKQLQMLIQEHSKKGDFIVITGKAAHPEVMGLTSYADESFVVNSLSDLELLKSKLPLPNRTVFIVSQTTGDYELFSETVKWMKTHTNFNLDIVESFCPVAIKREKAALKARAYADIVFVVGDRTSSNAKKLFNVLDNGRAYLVEDLEMLLSLKLNLSGLKKALLVSASSTPSFVEKEISGYLKNYPD